MNAKRLKMPVLTIIVFFFLLFSHLCAFGMKTVTLVLHVLSLLQILEGRSAIFPTVLPYIFSALSSIGLMTASILTIISLFRRKAGKLLLSSMIIALCALFISLISSPLTTLFFGYRISSSALCGWLGALLSFGAYLLFTLFLIGSFFKKSNVLTGGARHLFFLPCLLECAASLCKIGSLVSYIVDYFKMLFEAGIEINFGIVLSQSAALAPIPVYFWSPIALLLLGIFLKKTINAVAPAKPADLAEPIAKADTVETTL